MLVFRLSLVCVGGRSCSNFLASTLGPRRLGGKEDPLSRLEIAELATSWLVHNLPELSFFRRFERE